MKTRQTKAVDIGWMIAALFLSTLVLTSGVQAQKYAKYRVDDHGLTAPELYVLEQTEKGEFADLSEQIPDKEIRERVGKIGLASYLEQLQKESGEAFLRDYGNRCLLRAKFLETLLTGGFPEFKIHRHGLRIFNAIIDGPLDLAGAEVSQPFWLGESILLGEVNLRDSWFRQNLVLSGAQFRGDATFERIKVGKSIFLRRARFYEQVIFRLADIGVSLEAYGAQFRNKVRTANFDNMKVAQTVSLEKAEFQGPVNFRGAKIGNQFIADGTQFLSEKEPAIFNGMKVGQSAFFVKSTFQGPVNCGLMNIGRNLDVEGAKFLNETQEASFNSIKVGHSAHFHRTTFKGPTDFGSAEIESNFLAYGAQFLNKKQTATFFAMKVGKTAVFDKATFQGPVDFDSADIKSNFEASGTQFLNEKAATSFNSIMVGKNAIFYNTTFQGPVDLRFSSFQSCQFRNLTCHLLMLEGMNYKNIIYGDDWKNLLKLLEKSPYHAQPYSQLATFFQQSGYPERADEAFIAGKRRELGQKSWWNPATWFTFIFWDLLAGYGRKPFRCFGLGLAIVILGAIFVFDPRDLQLAALKKWNLDYDLKLRKISNPTGIMNFVKVFFLRFMVSFDQFIPAINLGLAPHWEPEDLSFRKWFFAYLQRISGWILIPIGLAAIASQFK